MLGQTSPPAPKLPGSGLNGTEGKRFADVCPLNGGNEAWAARLDMKPKKRPKARWNDASSYRD
jgi:hypothetical protein